MPGPAGSRHMHACTRPPARTHARTHACAHVRAHTHMRARARTSTRAQACKCECECGARPKSALHRNVELSAQREAADVEGRIRVFQVTRCFDSVMDVLIVTHLWVLGAKLHTPHGKPACACASCGCGCFLSLNGSTPLNPQLLDFWTACPLKKRHECEIKLLMGMGRNRHMLPSDWAMLHLPGVPSGDA